ncbi:hypothetical protein LGH83_08945 [Lichenihabitans sp. PAMC28606]|uniref:hypothetical protein n=1 Tax=Lichenihabitans sp. PAMC28606 TaxID=2880932 RepID=UPI001D0AA3E2|nr:hypothetical protein [Lichenihabitans sp. PAMC28606]UDL96283.1 hypothetical protein LGH83_08945 [Lichenihabitans sp. PAMC28606]
MEDMQEGPLPEGSSESQSSLSESDLAFWARLPGWSVREQAALLLGLNPESEMELEGSREYKRYCLMMNRVRKAGQLRPFPRPKSVLRWARSNKLPVPDNVRIAVIGGKSLINWRRRYLELKARTEAPNEEHLPPKTRKSLETILLAVARRYYGYHPTMRNSAAKMISADATINGRVLVGEETVRDRLRDANEALGDEFDVYDTSRIST